RNDNVFLAGLFANSLRYGITLLKFAAQKVFDDIAPDIFGLADDRRHSAFVEKLARVRKSADVEAAHHRRDSLGHELQREVAPARVLIRLHTRQADQQLDAVFARLVLDRRDGLGADDAVANLVPD